MPVVKLALKTVAWAYPVLVVTCVVFVMVSRNVPDAPVVGAVKVTVVLVVTGLPDPSMTSTSSWVANPVPTVVVWLLPAMIFRPSASFVKLKSTGEPAAPVTVAVTV